MTQQRLLRVILNFIWHCPSVNGMVEAQVYAPTLCGSQHMDSNNTSFSIIRQNGVQITTFVAKKMHCHHRQWWIWNACPQLKLSMCTLSWIDPTRGLSSTLRFYVYNLQTSLIPSTTAYSASKCIRCSTPYIRKCNALSRPTPDDLECS